MLLVSWNIGNMCMGIYDVWYNIFFLYVCCLFSNCIWGFCIDCDDFFGCVVNSYELIIDKSLFF